MWGFDPSEILAWADGDRFLANHAGMLGSVPFRLACSFLGDRSRKVKKVKVGGRLRGTLFSRGLFHGGCPGPHGYESALRLVLICWMANCIRVLVIIGSGLCAPRGAWWPSRGSCLTA